MAEKSKNETNLGAWALSGLGHLTATLIVFCIGAGGFLSETIVLVQTGLGDAQIQADVMKDLGILFGLSAAFWGILFIGYRWVQEGRRKSKKLAVVRARGAIMTETIIIFPVFLLLTFGLAQMGVNSMAGLLTTLGTFQAARTIAVWGPEEGNNRTGETVTREHVEDAARLSAASVIAPVAPMSAGNIACEKSDPFNDLVAGLVAAGLSPTETPQRYSTFSSSLERVTFAQRGPGKLAGAYCSTSVSFEGNILTAPSETSVEQFTVNVTYSHKMVFPLVGLAFGGTPSAGGWVTDVERTYSLTHHLTPNPELPNENDIL